MSIITCGGGGGGGGGDEPFSSSTFSRGRFFLFPLSERSAATGNAADGMMESSPATAVRTAVKYRSNGHSTDRDGVT